MNLKRTQAIMIREVTGQLPHLPDQWITDETTEPHPYARGRWFYVEIHLGNYGWFGPVALGIVSTNDDETRAEMVSMFVEDGVRLQGYGRQLIEIAGERWPDLTWTDYEAIRPFHLRLIEQGIAKQSHNSCYYQFIPKVNRKDQK